MSPVIDSFSGTRVAACLIVSDAAQSIEFYTQAFGALEVARETASNGQIHEAELVFGGCSLFIADHFPNDGLQCPQRLGGSSVTLRLFVPDVSKAVERARRMGAVMLKPERECRTREGSTATVLDPFGHVWILLTQPGGHQCRRDGGLVRAAGRPMEAP